MNKGQRMPPRTETHRANMSQAKLGSLNPMYGRRGAKNNAWKGGRRKGSDGYIRVLLLPDDFFYPMASKQSYVLEHRLVVAKALGRCLLPWETVHHKEGYAKDDNKYPETLELLPTPSKHDALTKMITYIRKLEREIERLKAS